MTLEEEQALVTNYFQNHPLDIQEASVSDEGTMHVRINLDGLQYIDSTLSDILETNHYKWLIRMGYTHGKSKGSSLGSFFQEYAYYNDLLPRHYYCDDNLDPLPVKIIDGGGTDPIYGYSFCPGPVTNNPSSGTNFVQNCGACLPTLHLFERARRDGYEASRADITHDSVNGYVCYTGNIGEGMSEDFELTRIHAARTMPIGGNQVEFEWTAIICFELVYSTKEMVRQRIKPIHLLYQLGPGNTGVAPIQDHQVTDNGTKINKYKK